MGGGEGESGTYSTVERYFLTVRESVRLSVKDEKAKRPTKFPHRYTMVFLMGGAVRQKVRRWGPLSERSKMVHILLDSTFL